MIKKITSYFQGVITETKKITWPSRQNVINYTQTVILSVIFIVIVFGLVDLGLSKLLEKLLLQR